MTIKISSHTIRQFSGQSSSPGITMVYRYIHGPPCVAAVCVMARAIGPDVPILYDTDLVYSNGPQTYTDRYLCHVVYVDHNSMYSTPCTRRGRYEGSRTTSFKKQNQVFKFVLLAAEQMLCPVEPR